MSLNRFSLLLYAILLLLLADLGAAEIAIKNGQKLAFLGDSITKGGTSPLGYVTEVVSGLAANGCEVTMIAAGVSGNTSSDMLARLDRDVLSKKPDWMTLSCGVNDVWHGANGVPLDKYKENITAILDKCKAANVQVMILTATVIYEDLNNANNKSLVNYNDFLRATAKQRGLLLADLNADVQTSIKSSIESGLKAGSLLTVDGVHMNSFGNIVMANGILRAFGLNDQQMKKAEEVWIDTPHAVTAQNLKVDLTMRQYNQLEAIAAKQNRKIDDLLAECLGKDIETLLKAK